MLSKRYLSSFTIFNLLLFFSFCLSVVSIDSVNFLNLLTYVLLNYLIIYLGLYYYRNILYLIYFVYGLGIDLLLINEIGPHLILFIALLFIFNFIKKFLVYLGPLQIYFIILLFQGLLLFLEMIFAFLLFGYDLDMDLYFKLIFISLIISYPFFFLFSKIDNFN